jgi:hypothetical protein
LRGRWLRPVGQFGGAQPQLPHRLICPGEVGLQGPFQRSEPCRRRFIGGQLFSGEQPEQVVASVANLPGGVFTDCVQQLGIREAFSDFLRLNPKLWLVW